MFLGIDHHNELCQCQTCLWFNKGTGEYVEREGFVTRRQHEQLIAEIMKEMEDKRLEEELFAVNMSWM